MDPIIGSLNRFDIAIEAITNDKVFNTKNITKKYHDLAAVCHPDKIKDGGKAFKEFGKNYEIVKALLEKNMNDKKIIKRACQRYQSSKRE